MWRYAVRRLALTVPVLLGVSVLVFAIMHVVPGDPVRLIAGPDAPEEVVTRMRAELGLDRPLHVQYLPGLAIFFTFNCLGDGLRDALDPRLRAKAAE